MAAKDFIRVNRQTGEQSATGRLFFDFQGQGVADLSRVRLLRCGVDTVRQLYRGMIRPEVMGLFEKPGTLVEFAGETWHAGRVGRDSGYQYKLQNADLGFILLIKNFNSKIENIGPHLKIEVSPHVIDSQSPDSLQTRLDGLAGAVLSNLEQNQCAVHLALDLQGWVPPADMVARMHCRARTVRDISGINELHWETKSSVYGRGETFMFGSAGGVQLAIYNKTEQARATDKLDYWEGVWKRRDSFDDGDSDNYDPQQDVWRVELRYHHSIVQQFANGSYDLRTGGIIDTTSYAAFSGHLDGLWRYGLRQFKLLARPGYFEPIWTLVREDVKVDLPVFSLLNDTEYRRDYKTARGFSGKNVELFLGNFISLLARERVPAKKAFTTLKRWDCWRVIREHYAAKGVSEGQLLEHIETLMQERHVRWGRAI
ncbi:hypothetical protein HW090_03275 [Pseudomonas sp. ABC1]|uniref:hypothetical protein n=1 Tax=Pseudomonas sp. ABC1 TaxID=2748080 RepID=UPI0015C33F9B|nr:hypothetical protein [Pseudomonas sp. ABC1]QLF92276.1 hypothetical protein HW090_03275 [Pseudomonas sp. ABC1]